MVSLDMLNQLKVNTQNTEIKSNNPNASKYEINDKQSFKNLLSKEFNERTINNTTKKSTASIESNEIKEGALEKEVVVDKKSLEEALNKVVELIDENSDKEKIDLGSISELLVLLSNLINNKDSITESSILEGSVDNNLATSIEDYSNIDVINNLENSTKLFDVMNFDSNKVKSLTGNEQEIDNNIEKILSDILTGGTILDEEPNIGALSILGNLTAVKDLLNEALVNSNNSEGDMTLNLRTNSLNNKLIEILSLISREDIMSMTKTMSSNEKVDFLNALHDIRNVNVSIADESEELPAGKESDLLSPLSVRIEYKETESYEMNKEGYNMNLNDEINEEDKLLLKILGEEDKNSFSNVLGSLNKATVNPSDIVVEPKEIHRQSFRSDIIQNVKYMIRNNVEELSIKIYPKELGELTIKIISEEGIMRAELRATSKETYNLLNSNLQEIKNNLQEQNVKIQEVSINIYNEDSTFFSGENRGSSNSENNKTENLVRGVYSEDQQEEDLENVNIDNNLNILA